MSRADIRLATFIDDTLREYASSAAFRAALHSEAPDAPAAIKGICPPEHTHGAASTCYQNHGCRCSSCRITGSRRQKRNRLRKAATEWRLNQRKSA